jgi:prepilin-type N-terminal cleavage/methylation domain-containing protein
MYILKTHNWCRNEKGMTLIELVIVVVIIGILASIAIPRFMRVSTKSKQSEAKGILKQIYINEETYLQSTQEVEYWIPSENASAGNPRAFATIWIDIMATARYTYTITGNPTFFAATATANLDDDATIDNWQIDTSGVLTCITNDADF